jgi:hypothetical protein
MGSGQSVINGGNCEEDRIIVSDAFIPLVGRDGNILDKSDVIKNIERKCREETKDEYEEYSHHKKSDLPKTIFTDFEKSFYDAYKNPKILNALQNEWIEQQKKLNAYEEALRYMQMRNNK